ncbi:MAG: UTP--glucose-1-phosphate uridylyltransferase GalU [bacterium]
MIRKAVIPAAGFGTRFLPLTKVQPKEMLPIVDKPTIQFVIEEAVKSGIHDILVIIGKSKRALEDHFDRSFELEAELKAKGKENMLKEINKITQMANLHFIRQKELNGLGDAISYARMHVGNEPFAVLLGDTIFDSKIPGIAQLMKIYEKYRKTVIGLERVPKQKVSKYGIIKGEKKAKGLYKITDFIEKPSIKQAPSNLAAAGRYILSPDIFNFLEKTARGKGNEIQLTDAIKALNKTQDIYGLKLDGIRYDIGDKLDFLKTNVIFALKRKELKDDFLEFLRGIVH